MPCKSLEGALEAPLHPPLTQMTAHLAAQAQAQAHLQLLQAQRHPAYSFSPGPPAVPLHLQHQMAPQRIINHQMAVHQQNVKNAQEAQRQQQLDIARSQLLEQQSPSCQAQYRALQQQMVQRAMQQQFALRQMAQQMAQHTMQLQTNMPPGSPAEIVRLRQRYADHLRVQQSRLRRQVPATWPGLASMPSPFRRSSRGLVDMNPIIKRIREVNTRKSNTSRAQKSIEVSMPSHELEPCQTEPTVRKGPPKTPSEALSLLSEGSRKRKYSETEEDHRRHGVNPQLLVLQNEPDQI